jgi:hypothetical protein
MITEVVKQINDSLLPSFEDIDVSIFGIAESILVREDDKESDDVYIPSIIDSDGECHSVFVDDDYKLGIYHRVLGKTYTNQPNKGFGDGSGVLVVADMQLVCWGFSTAVEAESVEQLIFSKSPEAMRFVSSDFDRKKVFSSEMQGIPFFLPPEVFLFSIKYKVQYKAKRACLEISDFFNT